MQAGPTRASRKTNIAYLSISEEFSWPVITQMLIFLRFTRRWIAFALIIPVTMVAAPIGAKIAHSLNKRQMEIGFGLFMLIVAARFFYSLYA